VAFGRAIANGHQSQAGLLTYALSLQHQGRAEEAIRVFRATLDLYPGPAVHQFLLYPHFLVEDGPRRYAAEARAWAERWAPAVGEPQLRNPPLAGRKLRIGYVSPSFSGSQVRQFITPVLEAHDPGAVQVVLYPAVADTETGHWPEHIAVRAIGQLSDSDAAQLIRDDEIDVLVDCWGHTAGSRLGLFARRAAPVQVGWINFLQTTGLKRMDYVLHADSMAAPGTAELFTEAVWSMGPIIAPFRPPANRPDPTPTPALRTGQITFASFNHPVKLTDPTVRAWSRILVASPKSRLLLKYRYFVDPVLRRVTIARFRAEGVEPERIAFQGHSEGADYLAAFGEVDLALDPSPGPGGTTTLDALAMGVPVLTLAGADFYARIGIQAVEGAGLPELVAADWDAYVERAVALTADPSALDALRARVRPGLAAGPYGDEAGFTRRLEAAFAAMFDRANAPEVLAHAG
jgi:predicted O-linked N-acetylglucosamine transferase (SPINDLY family)